MWKLDSTLVCRELAKELWYMGVGFIYVLEDDDHKGKTVEAG